MAPDTTGGKSASAPDYKDDTVRSHIATRALTVSLLVTLILGLIELVFYFFSRNNLFLIEGAGNIAWLVPDFVMLATVKVGNRKPDLKMNYGYRRIETIFLLFFSLAVGWFVLSLLEKTLREGPEALPPGYGAATVGLALVILLVLFFLYRYLRDTGKAISSRILLMDSMVIWMDMASAGILVLSGIFLILMPEVHFLQIALTLVVGFALLAYSVKEAVAAAKELIDASPSLAVTALVETITEETPAVLLISDQRIRSFGGAVAVDLTVETAPFMTVAEAYRVATEIEEKIREKVENVIEVKVRVHPAGAFVVREVSGGTAGGRDGG
jgi:cation diffusion facilitator family transporter